MWGFSVKPRPLFTPGKDPVPIVQEAEWGPRAGLDRCGKSRPTGIRSPDLPARSQSLYRLRYPTHVEYNDRLIFTASFTYGLHNDTLCTPPKKDVTQKYRALVCDIPYRTIGGILASVFSSDTCITKKDSLFKPAHSLCVISYDNKSTPK